MTLGFLNERLNVTPESVEASHQLLLQSVNPRYYHEIAAAAGHGKPKAEARSPQ